MKRRILAFHVPFDFLDVRYAYSLLDCLPARSSIVNIRQSDYNLVYIVFVESDFFPIMESGNIPVEIHPIYLRQDGKIHVEWRWCK